MSFLVLLDSCMRLNVTTYICNKTCHANIPCCALPAVAAQAGAMSAIQETQDILNWKHVAAEESAYKAIAALWHLFFFLDGTVKSFAMASVDRDITLHLLHRWQGNCRLY